MKKNRGLWFIPADFFILGFSFYLGFYFRFDGTMPPGAREAWVRFIFLFIGIKLIVFYVFKLYHILWQFAGLRDLWRIIVSSSLGSFLVFLLNWLLHTEMPRSVFPVVYIMDTVLIIALRMMYRSALGTEPKFTSPLNRTLIVGAGEAGSMVVEEIRRHKGLGLVPVGYVDDDPGKRNKRVNDLPVLGDRYDIPQLVEHYEIERIILALPSAAKQERLSILEIANRTKARIQLVPGLYELIDGKVDIHQLREVQVEDLLGRPSVKLDNRHLKEYLKNRSVLITGAGGSIGSELSRQIARYQPKKLFLLDIYENGIYDLEQELKQRFPHLEYELLVESVRDKERIDRVIRRHRPEIIFHAAAHKHVPLMEKNPFSAVLNNVYGTKHVMESAGRYGTDSFVFISTDKAVNPSSVMGCTKRICEKMVQIANEEYATNFVSVRFGNVLGSSGSVIPLFKQQIARGGPVTVTDARILRYFMTIPEACQLVLIAGAMAQGGEIFVLDMGEPVKILDLAENLIRLSGKEPGKDIQIQIVGLRPGEKLYEEILLDKENMEETMNHKIFVESPEDLDPAVFEEDLKKLYALARGEDSEALLQQLEHMVPTYDSSRRRN